MDFGKAFSYPFQDQDWLKKLLIPGLLLIVPIFGTFVVLGWMVEIIRRVIRQDPTPLPEINFSEQFVEGLKAFVISFVYALPVLVMDIPITIVSAMQSSGNGSDQANGLTIIVSLCCGGLIFLYSLFLGVIAPAAIANFAAKRELSAGFNFREVWGLVRAAPGAYLLVLVGALLSSIVGSLGVLALCIGALFTYAYAMAINGHLYGQAYNEATKNTGFARVY